MALQRMHALADSLMLLVKAEEDLMDDVATAKERRVCAHTQRADGSSTKSTWSSCMYKKKSIMIAIFRVQAVQHDMCDFHLTRYEAQRENEQITIRHSPMHYTVHKAMGKPTNKLMQPSSIDNIMRCRPPSVLPTLQGSLPIFPHAQNQ